MYFIINSVGNERGGRTGEGMEESGGEAKKTIKETVEGIEKGGGERRGQGVTLRRGK